MIPRIGVLALQGDVLEHVHALEKAGAHAIPVRRVGELDSVNALVVPGGESTTIGKLARTFDLLEPLQCRIAAGMPVFGSCAGMILLADRILDAMPGQDTFGGLDVTVRRNAFGRQVESFEADIELTGVAGGPVHTVFIRAPWVESTGSGVEVLGRATVGAQTRIVAVRQGPVLATSFHPELTGDQRVHALFVDMVRRDMRDMGSKDNEQGA